MPEESPQLLPGTLYMLVLRTLAAGPLHGYAIARRIKQCSANVLDVEEGSLYPSLNRMLLKGWLRAEWGTSETNRKARFYRLTKDGQKQLASEADDGHSARDENRLRMHSMQFIKELWRRLHWLAGRSRFDSELADEIQFHIESRAEELEKSGVPRADAIARARREFGSRLKAAEDTSGAWQVQWLEDLFSDLRYAARALRRNAGFALTAISCLA